MHLLFKRPRDFARELALFTAPYQPQARKGVALPLRFPVPAFSLPLYRGVLSPECNPLKKLQNSTAIEQNQTITAGHCRAIV